MKNPFAALKRLFNGDQVETPADNHQGGQAAAEVPMREAAGATIDADEEGWRRLALSFRPISCPSCSSPAASRAPTICRWPRAP